MATAFRAVIRRFADVPRAVAFYRDGLGLTVGVNHEDRMIEFYTPGGSIFEVAEGSVVEPVTDRWDAHDTPFFEVEDVDAQFAQLIAHGGTVINAPFNVGARRRLAYVADTEGHILGIGMNRRDS